MDGLEELLSEHLLVRMVGMMLVSPVMVMMKTLLVRMLVSLVWKGVEKQQAADYDDGGAARRLGGRSGQIEKII